MDYIISSAKLKNKDIEIICGKDTLSGVRKIAEKVSGDIKAVFAGNKNDYSYNFDMTSGDVRLAGAKFDGDYREDNNTGKEIKVEMTSGSAEIDFK